MKETEDYPDGKIYCVHGFEVLKWPYYPDNLQTGSNSYQNTNG